jgi:hypothetical protein
MPFNSIAQQLNLPLNYLFNLGREQEMATRDSFEYHTGIKPIIENKSLSYKQFQQLNKTQQTKHFAWLMKDSAWLKKKFKYENLFEAKGEDYYLEVNPAFNFEYGRDIAHNDKEHFYFNSRGIRISAHVTKKFSFSTTFYENQSKNLRYIRDYANSIGVERFINGSWRIESPVMPGQGRTKPFKNNAYDYAWAEGYGSFSPTPNTNIQLGNGKFFIGDGYRSMLLSDNSFNYPFLRLTQSFLKGRAQYTVIYAYLQHYKRIRYYTTPEPGFEKKNASFHYLSFNILKNLQIGIFESTIWQRADETQKLQPVDYSFYNPVIGINALRFGFNANNNVLAGVNAKYQPYKKVYFYMQAAADNPAKNRWAFQLGGKIFDLFNFRNLSAQLEFNSATKYTYTHENYLQNYSHSNQPLAHPSGSGFWEVVSTLHYRIDDWIYEFRINYLQYRHYNNSIQYGKDIFVTANAPAGLESKMARLNYRDFKIGYLFNHKTNMIFFVGWFYRDLCNAPGASDKTSYIYVSLRTSLSNFFYDF